MRLAGFPKQYYLIAATFFVAISGLIYELIAGAVSSYLLGDSVRQFSFVIGVFMTSMGIGSWISRFIESPLKGFINCQFTLAIVGGFSAPILFFSFAIFDNFSFFLYLIVISIGILSGLEIPLVIKLLEKYFAHNKNSDHHLSNALTADYLGALVAALLFPTIIVPHIGLVSASLLFGIINLMVCGLIIFLFKDELNKIYTFIWCLVLALMSTSLFYSSNILTLIEKKLYEDDIIYAQQSPYQRIVVTNHMDRTKLFLNGAIQFDTYDEFRYHESLVHPAMQSATQINDILVLGGGDGMAVREVLKYDVKNIDLVDLDKQVTDLFMNSTMSKLNDQSLNNNKVKVYHIDALEFIKTTNKKYDVIIADLPDPSTYTVSKLYSQYFYNKLLRRLNTHGVFVTQAGSPTFAREAFWSIEKTLSKSNFLTMPYHVYLPSFGDWGFVLSTAKTSITTNLRLAKIRDAQTSLRFYDDSLFKSMLVFSKDIDKIDVEVNKLNNHLLVQYYHQGWNRWFK